MRKSILLLLIAGVLGWTQQAQAQQQSMYTLYMFNQLAYNPAYAGSPNALDVSLLHRHQWYGFGADAPMTQNLSIHAPLRTKNIALGMNLNYDRIAVTQGFSIFPSFAYRIKFGDHSAKGKGGYISLGLQGGVSNFTSDWTQLNLDDPNDPAFQVQRPNIWLPNFGTGIYIHTKTWYVGLSAPMLITNSLRKRTSVEPIDLPIAQQYRHYYLSAGMAFKINSDVVIRPTLLVKNVGMYIERNALGRIGAPTEFDIDLAVLLKRTIWFGVSFRSAFELNRSSYDSVDFWGLVRLKNGVGIGAAFDYTLNRLRPGVQGSYEMMLRYDLIRSDADGGTSDSKLEHVRYF